MVFGKAWTKVANNALVRIGRSKVQTLDDMNKDFDVSLVRDEMEFAITEVLSMRNWRCMTIQTQLAKLNVTPSGFKYRYALPEDYVRIVGLHLESPQMDYALRVGAVDTDSDTIYLDYIKIPDDTSKYPVWMANLFSLSLANKICLALTADKSILSTIQAEYNSALAYAAQADNSDVKDSMMGSSINVDSLDRWRN